jgi:hypothetical protein
MIFFQFFITLKFQLIFCPINHHLGWLQIILNGLLVDGSGNIYGLIG